VEQIENRFSLSNIFIFVLKFYHHKIMAKALVAHEANFESLINTNKPVLIDFWAEWCGPCRMIGPVVEELAGEMEGIAVIAKVDVDSNPNLSVQYGIRSIPALMVFKNGQVVEKMVGIQPKAELEKRIKAHL
jgi:thioredoxin 1